MMQKNAFTDSFANLQRPSPVEGECEERQRAHNSARASIEDAGKRLTVNTKHNKSAKFVFSGLNSLTSTVCAVPARRRATSMQQLSTRKCRRCVLQKLHACVRTATLPNTNWETSCDVIGTSLLRIYIMLSTHFQLHSAIVCIAQQKRQGDYLSSVAQAGRALQP